VIEITAPPITQEELLRIWIEQKPSAHTPRIYGSLSMWRTAELPKDYVLFTRPEIVLDRSDPFTPYKRVDGVAYQFQKDGKWVGRDHADPFGWVAEKGFHTILYEWEVKK